MQFSGTQVCKPQVSIRFTLEKPGTPFAKPLEVRAVHLDLDHLPDLRHRQQRLHGPARPALFPGVLGPTGVNTRGGFGWVRIERGAPSS